MLYRDCLRLVRHIAPGNSPKALALTQQVQLTFRANKAITDKAEVEVAKAAAVRALANYMLYEGGQKDSKMKQAMERQVSDEFSKEGGK